MYRHYCHLSLLDEFILIKKFPPYSNMVFISRIRQENTDNELVCMWAKSIINSSTKLFCILGE